ncbi:lipoprotein-releasing system ATP-binding protein LolD [Bacteroidia bacterium]|nr:lipoprotein-releasing system ATP-binding protein LolD [Bacteroidia bacterium]
MIETKGIEKSFGTLKVLKSVDLQVNKGEIVSIVGASGAGKTTLLQIIGTLDKPDRGTVVVDSVDVNRLKEKQLAHFRNQHIGFVFQFHQLLPEFSALENVLIPSMIAHTSRTESTKYARQLFDFLQLKDRETHKPNELSGGEKQRVAVARALINRPKLILADEPSGSLDSQNKEELHRLLFDLRRELGLTIVIVTHDEQLANLSDRIIRMKDGQIEG